MAINKPGKRKHCLMTAKIRKATPAIGETDGQGDTAVVQAKYFSPYSAVGDWHLLEYDPETHQCFGLVGGYAGNDLEYGYFNLQEMDECTVFGCVPAIERDCYTKPYTVGELRQKVEKAA